MIFGVVQPTGHSLSRRKIEEVLRLARTGSDSASEQFMRPVVQSEQAENAAERVERLRRGADDMRSGIGGVEHLRRFTEEEQAFCAQDVRDWIVWAERHRLLGAYHRRVGAAPQQRGFCQ